MCKLLCCVIIVCVISVSFCVYCGVQGEICADFDVFQDVVISNVSVCKCIIFLWYYLGEEPSRFR